MNDSVATFRFCELFCWNGEKVFDKSMLPGVKS